MMASQQLAMQEMQQLGGPEAVMKKMQAEHGQD